MSARKCGLCGNDPAAGFASINDTFYCHGDENDSPTCYERATIGSDAEIARLREFGEHYSGAAQDAWDRIVVLEKALQQIADQQQKTLSWLEGHEIVFADIGTDPQNWEHIAFSIYTDLCEVDTWARHALAAGSVSPEEASAPCPSCGPDGTHDISFDRSLCACGAMHYFCVECGRQTDPCAAAVVSTEPTA